MLLGGRALFPVRSDSGTPGLDVSLVSPGSVVCDSIGRTGYNEESARLKITFASKEH